MDVESAGELRRYLAMWATNINVSGVVLRGSDGVFCGGADIDWLAKHRNQAPHLYEALRGLYTAVAEHPKPVVAFLNGDVNGAGIGLANTGRRVALASMRFSIPEACVVRFNRSQVSTPCLKLPPFRLRLYVIHG